MNKKVTATRDSDGDSQNCYVFKHQTGPGQVIVKIWVPRRLVQNDPPTYLDITIKSARQHAPRQGELFKAKGAV